MRSIAHGGAMPLLKRVSEVESPASLTTGRHDHPRAQTSGVSLRDLDGTSNRLCARSTTATPSTVTADQTFGRILSDLIATARRRALNVSSVQAAS